MQGDRCVLGGFIRQVLGVYNDEEGIAGAPLKD